MYHAWQNMGEIGSNFGGSYMTDPLLLTANRNCPMRRFLRKKTSFGYFCWETPRMNMGVSQEGKCLLNIVSQKLISYDFCTSSVLHKVKKTFGGSKWKLIELTRVSRYLAYVTRECVAKNWKTSWRWKNKPLQHTKNLSCREDGCCCATYVMVCAGKKRKLSMERETWGFDFVIRPLFLCVLGSPKSSQRWLTSAWNPDCLIV